MRSVPPPAGDVSPWSATQSSNHGTGVGLGFGDDAAGAVVPPHAPARIASAAASEASELFMPSMPPDRPVAGEICLVRRRARGGMKPRFGGPPPTLARADLELQYTVRI